MLSLGALGRNQRIKFDYLCCRFSVMQLQEIKTLHMQPIRNLSTNQLLAKSCSPSTMQLGYFYLIIIHASDGRHAGHACMSAGSSC